MNEEIAINRKEITPLRSPYTLFTVSESEFSLNKPIVAKRFNTKIDSMKKRGLIQAEAQIQPWRARFAFNGRPILIESGQFEDEYDTCGFAIYVDQSICEQENETPREVAELAMDVLGIGDLKST